VIGNPKASTLEVDAGADEVAELEKNGSLNPLLFELLLDVGADEKPPKGSLHYIYMND
jgi:hypothetical protein